MTSEIDWTKASGRKKPPTSKHFRIQKDEEVIVDDIKFEVEGRRSDLWWEIIQGAIIVGVAVGTLYLVVNWNSIFPSGISIDSGLMDVIFPFIIFLPILIIIWYMSKRYI